MRRALAILALVAAGAMAAAGCAGQDDEGEPAAAGPATAAPATTADPGGGDPDPGGVRIEDFAFAPGSVAVEAGQQVTWAHRDAGVVHTVTADKGEFRSGDLGEGDEFPHRFPAAGAFAYHCAIHPDMRGTVRVGG